MIYTHSATGAPMHSHRFGRKIKLPATIAIKHQIRKLMFEEAVKKVEQELKQFADNGAKKHDEKFAGEEYAAAS
jgi:hypothetical protein